MATGAILLKFVLTDFKFELALTAIFCERHFLIFSNLGLSLNWRFPSFSNTATSAVLLN